MQIYLPDTAFRWDSKQLPFPSLHEKVTYDHYEFEVLEMDNRRILKVKFTINTPPSDSDKKD